ncbi:(deoxy)nucleoside triphosphate pyrophosphohydrolase [uncultured Tessaracoccus sp.]|uniref:(deoxy)nucleoside triphosphate pyrophosphohydrolase n=1 Tax=uncultured Tessaracoccus sp. TaxID=905023 RepID=UPI00262EFCC1|nr:(deoxy)nucleoside triphosphate pyrophosphohydrolase [uncultured Tessaracoccus sp.]
MERIEVVGAVIMRDGLVFAARRGPGRPLDGLWEFPGGKLEPAETPSQALVREIQEELGCTVQVGEHLVDTEHAYSYGLVALSTYRCTIVDGEPQLTEHSEARWVAIEELTQLDWAPADLPTVAFLTNG